MNSNNYIRKIDELGRIVIPKEVRNKLKIGENENILISYDDKKINISKYSHLENYNKYLKEIGELTSITYRIEISILDRNSIVYTNNKNNYPVTYESEIINDSINIGKIIIYSPITEPHLQKVSKYLAQLIEIFIKYI